ncbi:MAG: MCE family protein [Lentisphaeria bacterium]|nr:MCE family protein [Lentisphaeria bacterium]
METNKFKLGLFVTCAVLLFVAAVTCMGLFDFLNAKAYLRTTVTESVQGLNTGSQVKLRGVPIGKITDIIIHMESKNICLEMEVDLQRFASRSQSIFSNSAISKEEFYQLLHKEIKSGLRCRIEPDGITGMKYLEIDFFNNVKPVSRKESPGKINSCTTANNSKYFFIPSTPSMLASLRLTMTDILAKIAMIDFDGIARRSNLLLENVNKIVQPQKVDKLITQLDKCVESIRKTSDTLTDVLDKKEINDTLADIKKAVNSIAVLSTDIRKNINDSNIPGTVAGLRDLTDEIEDSSKNVNNTIGKLNDAIDALTELAQYLNDHPSALIYGKTRDEK